VHNHVNTAVALWRLPGFQCRKFTSPGLTNCPRTTATATPAASLLYTLQLTRVHTALNSRLQTLNWVAFPISRHHKSLYRTQHKTPRLLLYPIAEFFFCRETFYLLSRYPITANLKSSIMKHVRYASKSYLCCIYPVVSRILCCKIIQSA
jgi:hypothetical protein